jgi:hypothetical protein
VLVVVGTEVVGLAVTLDVPVDVAVTVLVEVATVVVAPPPALPVDASATLVLEPPPQAVKLPANQSTPNTASAERAT